MTEADSLFVDRNQKKLRIVWIRFCLTSKKAELKVGHLNITWRKAILASSGDIPESWL